MSLLSPFVLLRAWSRRLTLVGALLTLHAWALAQGVTLQQLNAERVEDGLALSFSSRFELPRPAEDALLKGVAIYFVAEVQVLRNRWYWRDARVARATRTWRLTWQPLTRQYRVSTGGLHQSFDTLGEAVASLRGVSGWRVADAKEIEDDGNYYLEFSYKLDTSQLPRPMQIGLGAGQGWALSVERNLQLNLDAPSTPPPNRPQP
ncbi:DUF4390 domain-containing protein [Roseateles depolymerans]|uniref:Uncharacterized protein n=1 Tax=Roseateles depolymerans TaxID=76731 RepID=A0A0U2UAU8_9BURK|nr:DUF4390 domain-containing protein [Roseateles depolymerans]ALV08993.1 hypothetical protein RD2015_4552 [Roseateles depolymerans]REG10076.1 uncharacterized protein DUF4390 [Roseateles depolymerans]